MILEDIVRDRKAQLLNEMQEISIDGWINKFKKGLQKSVDFYSALKKNKCISVIAEIKKASPSKGLIKDNFDPVNLAREYRRGGADAISVLTETKYFSGSNQNLTSVRQISPLPILRKDFIIDVWQVYQSKYIGADAILLIASILSLPELKKCMAVAKILDLNCLVEVHDEVDLEKALEAEARIIGINNRNLKTFEVDIKNTEKLINKIPRNKLIVSESGINTRDDVEYLKSIGVNAVLVGEAIMRSESPADKINELKLTD